MTKPSWKDLAELVGLTAIVASLLFVGLQMQQSHRIALAAQYQSRAETVMALQQTAMEIGYLPRVPGLRNGVTEDITATDINNLLWLWIAMDNHYYQYGAGFLDEEAWQGQLRNIVELRGECDVRFVWDWRKNGLRAGFVEMVESIEDPCS
jgi:hypothetical protein